MKKKLLSVLLAGTMTASVVAASAVAVSADEDKAPGGYGVAGEYTPGDPNTKTLRLTFAMPGAWQNDTTKDDRCGGVAGIYWWTGFDTPDSKFGHGWPGWKTKKVEEENVENLFEINVPTYGNGENGDAMQIIWNNYLDGGTETDPAKNPFYDASQQSRDFLAQYYSRTDEHDTYDVLFRYIYKTLFEKEEIAGAADVDLKSETFWVDLNKVAAAHLGRDYDKLSADAKTYQVDEILDEMDFDLSDMFGDYAKNFFNEDLVGEDDLYPAEDSNGFGMSFTFEDMVFVVNLDPAKMSVSPLSGKISWDGDFYFYYGNGEYGSWPTKELNDQMKETLGAENVVSGNIMSDEYYKSDIHDIEIPTAAPQPTSATKPAAATDASSSTKDTASGSTTANSSNGAVATGQVSLIAVLVVIIAAGIGVAFFTRKRYHK